MYPNIIFSDARHIEASDLTQLVEQDTKQPFDLTQPPLWRIHCYERGQNHYVIAFVIHHALMDFGQLVYCCETLANVLDSLQSRMQ